MAWSSYAHLPTTFDEYKYIINNLNNGMMTSEVDQLIAIEKGKSHVQHHYRSNLARLGIFSFKNGKLVLHYPVNDNKADDSFIKNVLKEAVKRNNDYELKKVKELILKNRNYDVETVARSLSEMYNEIPYTNFRRWIRPIVKLYEIIDILNINKDLNVVTDQRKNLQAAYLKYAKKFGTLVPIEMVAKELVNLGVEDTVDEVILQLLGSSDVMYKIELIMKPLWADGSRPYKVLRNYYTHIRIKSNLLGEENGK